VIGVVLSEVRKFVNHINLSLSFSSDTGKTLLARVIEDALRTNLQQTPPFAGNGVPTQADRRRNTSGPPETMRRRNIAYNAQNMMRSRVTNC
jgi:hypothetical protein